MKDLKNMTKTELKVLQEKIEFELNQRKDWIWRDFGYQIRKASCLP